SIMQAARDYAIYARGYIQGRLFSLPHSPTELYGVLVSKVTSLITLPLPLLSVLALPFFGGSGTTVNLVVFYLTWSALVATHNPHAIESGGTLLIRLLCFLLPALSSLAIDCAVPSLSKRFKAQGARQLPIHLVRNKGGLVEIAGIAVLNTLLSVLLQAALEYATTQMLHMRSLLKVTAIAPLPWTMVKDVAKGYIVHGILRYMIHRYVLHTVKSPLRTWHLQWQHSVRLPFSLIAAYDHPVNYLLSQWLPVFAPAYLFRYHVLTWHVLLALTSLEELLVYSGFAVLPSSIIIPGMARRTDAHFESVRSGRIGNFGNLGVLDFVFGTACDSEVNVVDDLESETAKHRLQDRIESAVGSALKGEPHKLSAKPKNMS
ncbi:hypothetical protein M433DRAFT_64636, partial [Acidomyces richmondensis BFW]